MFASRIDSGLGKWGVDPSTRPRARRALAVGVAAAVGASLALAGAGAASADAVSSRARAQFIAGTVLGADLSNAAALRRASASNTGAQPTQTVSDPLVASVLRSIRVGSPNGIRTSLGDVVQLGVASQVAQASADGSAMASTGAVTGRGGLTVGKDVRGSYGDATLRLSKLLGSRFAADVADLSLSVKALAARAQADGTSARGQYTIADARITITSPAIAGLSARVTRATAAVRADLDRLSGPNGTIARLLNQRLTAINPLLDLTGGGARVSVVIDLDPNQILQSLLDTRYGTGAVSFDLGTGTIVIDLDTLLGGIDSLAPNTELLSDAVVNRALKSVTGTVSALAGQLVARLDSAILNARVTVRAEVSALTRQAPVLGQICRQGPAGSVSGGIGGAVGGVVGGSTGGILGGGTGGILGGGTGGGILGGLLGGSASAGGSAAAGASAAGSVTPLVGGVLCQATSTVRPDLKTALTLDIGGTVGGLAKKTAATASADLTLLGAVRVPVDVAAMVGAVGSGLTDGLLDGDGAVQRFTGALDTGLVQPAVDGLLRNDGSVASALTDALSVTANNQSVSAGTFTQSALRVRVLPAGGSGAAEVRLATARVGPGVTSVTPGAPGDPGTSGTPGAPGDPATPGEQGTPGSGGSGTVGGVEYLAAGDSLPAAIGRLATTGLGIGMLILLGLALAAAGAYLVRRGYLRRQPSRDTAHVG